MSEEPDDGKRLKHDQSKNHFRKMQALPSDEDSYDSASNREGYLY